MCESYQSSIVGKWSTNLKVFIKRRALNCKLKTAVHVWGRGGGWLRSCTREQRRYLTKLALLWIKSKSREHLLTRKEQQNIKKKNPQIFIVKKLAETGQISRVQATEQHENERIYRLSCKHFCIVCTPSWFCTFGERNPRKSKHLREFRSVWNSKATVYNIDRASYVWLI